MTCYSLFQQLQQLVRYGRGLQDSEAVQAVQALHLAQQTSEVTMLWVFVARFCLLFQCNWRAQTRIHHPVPLGSILGLWYRTLGGWLHRKRKAPHRSVGCSHIVLWHGGLVGPVCITCQCLRSMQLLLTLNCVECPELRKVLAARQVRQALTSST